MAVVVDFMSYSVSRLSLCLAFMFVVFVWFLVLNWKLQSRGVGYNLSQVFKPVLFYKPNALYTIST